MSRGGSGQGTLFSVILFLITVDYLLVSLEEEVSATEIDVLLRSRARYYADDLICTVNYPIDALPTLPNGKKTFLDDGRLQKYLTTIKNQSERAGMKLNSKKTAVLIANRREEIEIEKQIMFVNEKWQLCECITLADGSVMKVENKIKLLGCMVDEDVSFSSFISKRKSVGLYNLWKLRKLADCGLSEKHLLTTYLQYVRSALEYGLLSCFPSLLFGQLDNLEKVQRKATRIIMGLSPFRKPGDPT